MDCIYSTPVLAAIAIALLHAIVFLQSGFDKLGDYKGNLEWLKGHFGNSPFKNMVPFLLMKITAAELISGTLSLVAVIMLCICSNGWYWFLGSCVLSALTYLSLFLGQRIAKDYPGAASLVPYILVAIFGLALASYGLQNCTMAVCGMK